MSNKKLSHGFICGVNNVTITKILYWQNSKEINWRAFLWYITDFATVDDFGENWLKVNIVSDKQLNFFYRKVIEYNAEMCVHNYEIDITNGLWKTHKKGAEKNFAILQKLMLAKYEYIMLYKVWSKYGREHLWAYVDFRMETNALLIDYTLRKGIIASNTCSVPMPIPQEVFDKYGMNYRVLQETKSYDEYLAESKPKILLTYPTARKISPAQRGYLKSIQTPVITAQKDVPTKCDKCLFWNDDLDKCDKFGSCDVK